MMKTSGGHKSHQDAVIFPLVRLIFHFPEPSIGPFGLTYRLLKDPSAAAQKLTGGEWK